MKSENHVICIPVGGAFAADDAAARKRKELAEKLKRGEKVKTTPSGEIVGSNSPEAQSGRTLNVPDGKLALEMKEGSWKPSEEYSRMTICVPACGAFAADDAAARKRKELAEKLKRGEKVKTTPSGEIVVSNSPEAQSGRTLNVPDGKLAYSYRHWYERDPELFQAEKAAMARFWPDFQLDKLDDGRLCWIGSLTPIKGEITWTVMAVYEHDHPNNNSSYGTSVKIYSIDPDLDEISSEITRLPHVLRDGQGNLYMCTNRQGDSTDGTSVVTTACTALSWAAKWTAAVTLWLYGDIDDATMSRHDSYGV